MLKAAEHARVARVSRVSGSFARVHLLVKAGPKHRIMTTEHLEDLIEDAELNAIADERAKGPFVSVSLDDL